jgi:hypothetical protein
VSTANKPATDRERLFDLADEHPTTWLVRKFFETRDNWCLTKCPKYRPLSDSCEALEDEADCPMLEELMLREMKKAKEEHV